VPLCEFVGVLQACACNAAIELTLPLTPQPPTFPPLRYSKGDVLLLKEVYDQYDLDKSGSVSITELQTALVKGPLAGSTDSMLAELDKNGDGSVEFPELLKVRLPRPAPSLPLSPPLTLPAQRGERALA
jgi:hypothetical protein